MTVDEAVEWLERGLEVKEGTPASKCQTGEPYVSFASGGVKPEGEPSPGYDTEDLAIRYWLKHALAYKLNQTHLGDISKFKIYWRTRLEHDIFEGKVYTFARFVITDKEEINEQH